MPKAIDTRKKAILLVAGVLLLVAMSFTAALLLKLRPNGQTLHAEFRQEFESFIPPPDAVSVQDNDVEQSRYGLVGEAYTTSLTFEDVRKHYEKQLVEKGYTFKEAIPVKDWGKDYGAEVVHYCKGDRMASIYKPGNSSNKLKYQFSFSLSGNAFECRSFFRF